VSRKRNCLSNWFPRLEAAALPIPKTILVEHKADLSCLLDGKLPDGWMEFVERIKTACETMGLPASPVFLRTGQISGKHRWKETCFLKSSHDIQKHIVALVEWSGLVDFIGLPHDVWAVREMLPVEPIATLPAYCDMPLVKEVRAFIAHGKVLCSHDYWPFGAISEGLGRKYSGTGSQLLDDGMPSMQAQRLHELASTDVKEREDAHALARRVSKVFDDDGAWSVDVLLTRNGWFVTDMADASQSYHDGGCKSLDNVA
jgi:hypothetical protein